ncbi:MAG TPA: DUF547 domain-containing protein [Xanthomonadales bacterium]|nr:DUF547 domain-containing protein [Xanthomonadales bacterium]
MNHLVTRRLLYLLATGTVFIMASGCSTPAPAPEPTPRGDVVSSDVPEPFWDFDPKSEFTINYSDVDGILSAMVIDVGRSSRQIIQPATAQTGTRLKANVKRTTSNEGNRFRFEEFEDNELYQQILRGIRSDLEAIPDQIPLEHFNRDEQLAYWLNLYNISLLEKLVEIYPERNLKQELVGRKSILDEKILNVSGIPLSLDDIQHTILRWNYDSNPLVIYGLYQGVVGGPNIRNKAYTGENVYRLLTDNAIEFINSNRGTYPAAGESFRVSGYYARNLGYFDNLDSHLKAHLLRYIEGVQEHELLDAKHLVPNLEDWTITDVYGTGTKISESFARNPAAVMGSAPAIDDVWLANIVSTRGSRASGRVATMSPRERFGPEATKFIEEFLRKNGINQKRTHLKIDGQIASNF